jgi:hypothetical protein
LAAATALSTSACNNQLKGEEQLRTCKCITDVAYVNKAWSATALNSTVRQKHTTHNCTLWTRLSYKMVNLSKICLCWITETVNHLLAKVRTTCMFRTPPSSPDFLLLHSALGISV